jgi:hypothetical protein
VLPPEWTATTSPWLAAGPGGSPLMLAVQGVKVHEQEILLARLDGLLEPVPAALTQVVNLPADIHAPTLAFNYAYHPSPAGQFPAPELRLSASIGLTTSVALTSTAWSFTWLDLADWAGQPITVEFTFPNAVTNTGAWLDLDDVVLGPWETPAITGLSVSAVPDLAALPLTATVTGENFMPGAAVVLGDTDLAGVLWIDPYTLELVLPADLPPGQYPLRVVNPGGASADWPGVLRVGQLLFLPSVGREN